MTSAILKEENGAVTRDLITYRRDFHSQTGEDGIIERITELLGISAGLFVEFGAWDGKHLSNTYHLVEKGWKGCYIEGDPKRFDVLCRNIPSSDIIKINAFVAPDGPSALDNLLASNGVSECDVLSIDIDSDDLAVWRGATIPAKIVVIEYNPLIPFDTRYINPTGTNHGNSALSLTELGEAKGYSLVEGLPWNLVFVRRDLADAAGIPSKSLQRIRDQTNAARWFFGYDGTLVQHPSELRDMGMTEIIRVPWGGMAPQPLPKMFQFYSDQRSMRAILRSVYCAMTCALRSPRQTLRCYRSGRWHA